MIDIFKFFKKSFHYKQLFINDKSIVIENKLQSKISKELEEYNTLITDIFYSIYEETNFDFDDFMSRLQSRLEHIGILNENEITSYMQGGYSSSEKAIKITPEYLINELDDFTTSDLKELNEYKLTRVLIHEGIHCIANNNFSHRKEIPESRYLNIYNELKTIQLEYKIYNKYFKEIFKKGELINDKLNFPPEYYNELDYRTFYGSENKINYEGYSVLNKMSSYIDLLNKNIDRCFLGKEDILKTSLNNEIYEDFSQKALGFIRSINDYHRIDNLQLFETIESFYRTIDYGIKENIIKKDDYLNLKQEILNSEVFTFKEIDTEKNFIKNGKTINFDTYFFNKIEEKNYSILRIEEPINKENQQKVEEHFESVDFAPNINSLEANITIDRSL